MERTDAEPRSGGQPGAVVAHEKRSEWKFSAGDNGLWRWRVTHPDGAQLTGHAGFTTLKDCIADARQHGYVVWLPEAERRRADY